MHPSTQRIHVHQGAFEIATVAVLLLHTVADQHREQEFGQDLGMQWISLQEALHA